MKRTALLIIACAAAVACSQPADERETEETGKRTRVDVDSIDWYTRLGWDKEATGWIDFEKETICTIRSVEELMQVLKEGSEVPEIDFSRQSIIVAGSTLRSGYSGFGAQLEIGPDDGILRVEIIPNLACVTQPWRVVVYTAPIADGIDIALDLKLVAPGDTISLTGHAARPLVRTAQ